MGREVRFHPSAKRQLFDLYEHIASDGDAQRAGAYLARIEAACLSLADFPDMGRAAPELGQGLRQLAFERRAVIVYRTGPAVVEILGVYFGGRDIAALLGG